MSSENLTKEQLVFLEECNLEFSERYTDADLEYKKVYDTGIPPPPIVHPWYGKGRFNNRGRGGGGRFNHYGNRNRDHRFEGNNRNRDYGYAGSYREQPGSSQGNHQYRERYSYEDNRRQEQQNQYRQY